MAFRIPLEITPALQAIDRMNVIQLSFYLFLYRVKEIKGYDFYFDCTVIAKNIFLILCMVMREYYTLDLSQTRNDRLDFRRSLVSERARARFPNGGW